MKIQFLKSGQINYTKWDACIENSLNTYIYAQSWYLDLVAEDWDALVMGDYEYVFPLPFRVKGRIKYAYQPIFTQQLGVFSSKTISQEILSAFIEAIPKEYKLIELNLNKFNKLDSQYISVRNTNVELDLMPSYETLTKGYGSNLKRNIKKASKQELSLDKNIKPEDLVELFSTNRGKVLEVFSEYDYKRLNRLMYMLIYRGLAQVWGVYNDSNQLVAGCLWAKSKHRWILLFSGLSELGKNLSAMHYLIDEFVKTYAGTHAILDFEGSNDPGLQRFILGFGSTIHSYQSIRVNRLSALSKLLITIYKKLK